MVNELTFWNIRYTVALTIHIEQLWRDGFSENGFQLKTRDWSPRLKVGHLKLSQQQNQLRITRCLHFQQCPELQASFRNIAPDFL